MRKKRKKRYYQVRAELLWGMIIGVLLLTVCIFFKDEIHEKWLQSGGTETVALEGLKSSLKDKRSCYLCGSSPESLMDSCRKLDSIGVISLNDWYVLDFRLDLSGEDYAGMESGGSTFGSTGEMRYLADGYFSGEMASLKVTLPKDYELKTEKIQNNLCQKCLDRVTESLEIHKLKREQKKAVPICLVDYQSLEIYSVQEWHKGCLIRDYWVEIETEENEIELDAYRVQGYERS